MIEKIIISGFGGQGVLVTGKLLAYAGMLEGRNVSWMPSYGPEKRGGPSECSVVISSEDIGSPIVTEPNTLIAMNKPSLERFVSMVAEDGLLIYNSSLIREVTSLALGKPFVEIIPVPANELAENLGNVRVANTILLGAYLERKRFFRTESIIESMRKVLPSHRYDLIPLNEKALALGIDAARRGAGPRSAR